MIARASARRQRVVCRHRGKVASEPRIASLALTRHAVRSALLWSVFGARIGWRLLSRLVNWMLTTVPHSPAVEEDAIGTPCRLDACATSCTFGVISERGKRLTSAVVETNGRALVEFIEKIPGRKHLSIDVSLVVGRRSTP